MKAAKAFVAAAGTALVAILGTVFNDQLADGSLSLGEILYVVAASAVGGAVVYRVPNKQP